MNHLLYLEMLWLMMDMEMPLLQLAMIICDFPK